MVRLINSCIYKIVSPSNKVYIGQTVNYVQRFNSYKRLKLNGQRKLLNSFIKYGVENHKFIILTECEPNELNSLEKHYSELYDSLGYNGLNIRECGGSKGKLSSETKQLISKSLKGNIVSDETRLKISKKLKGNVPYNKGKKGIQSAWNKGIKQDESVKIKLSKLYSGKFGKDCLSSKKIGQYDLDGVIIHQWYGAKEIERKMGYKCSVINRAARGERKTAYGFVWKYE